MRLVEGKILAGQILIRVKNGVEKIKTPISLHVILIGNDQASIAYVKVKEKSAQKVGVEFFLHHFPRETNEKILAEVIQNLNRDQNVTGFFLQLPLPSHLKINHLVNLINPLKDVDCLTAENLGLLAQNQPRFLPATAAVVEVILKSEKFDLRGKQVVVVGRSRIAGLPIALRALHQDATITVCHRQTLDLGKILTQADLVISAVGSPGLIKAGMLKPGVGVIDIGWARVNEKPVGDVDPDGLEKAASFYTPVPGGIGPITVACLLQNVLLAHQTTN